MNKKGGYQILDLSKPEIEVYKQCQAIEQSGGKPVLVYNEDGNSEYMLFLVDDGFRLYGVNSSIHIDKADDEYFVEISYGIEANRLTNDGAHLFNSQRLYGDNTIFDGYGYLRGVNLITLLSIKGSIKANKTISANTKIFETNEELYDGIYVSVITNSNIVGYGSLYYVDSVTNTLTTVNIKLTKESNKLCVYNLDEIETTNKSYFSVSLHI